MTQEELAEHLDVCRSCSRLAECQAWFASLPEDGGPFRQTQF
jgi:hypothetical protein